MLDAQGRIEVDSRTYKELLEAGDRIASAIEEEGRLQCFSHYIDGQNGRSLVDPVLVYEIDDAEALDLAAYAQHLQETIGLAVPLRFLELPFPIHPIMRGRVEVLDPAAGRMTVANGAGLLDVAIIKGTVLEDQAGEAISLEELLPAMNLEIYSRYPVEDAEPARLKAEKVLIAPATYDLTSPIDFYSPFMSSVSGLPIAFRAKLLEPGLKVVLEADSGRFLWWGDVDYTIEPADDAIFSYADTTVYWSPGFEDDLGQETETIILTLGITNPETGRLVESGRHAIERRGLEFRLLW